MNKIEIAIEHIESLIRDTEREIRKYETELYLLESILKTFEHTKQNKEIPHQ
jgi:hypothetical protein